MSDTDRPTGHTPDDEPIDAEIVNEAGDAAPTGQANTTPTGKTDSSPTGQANTTPTGKTDSSPTGQADTTPADQADTTQTGQADTTQTGQADSSPAGQADTTPTVPDPTALTPPPPVVTDYTDQGVPTLDYVRDKIEGRAATAQGWEELAGGTEAVQAAEEQFAERERKGREKLEELRRSLGL